MSTSGNPCKWVQAKDAVERRISGGELRAPDRISVADLARSCRVAWGTARRALRDLEERGIVREAPDGAFAVLMDPVPGAGEETGTRGRELAVKAESKPSDNLSNPMAALLDLNDLGYGAALDLEAERAAQRIACAIADGKTKEECTALWNFLRKVEENVLSHKWPNTYRRQIGHD